MSVKLACSLLVFILGFASAARVDVDIRSHSQTSDAGPSKSCRSLIFGSVEAKVEDEGTLREFYKWVTQKQKDAVKKLCVCDDLTHEVYTLDGVKGMPSSTTTPQSLLPQASSQTGISA
mmetsp:Transcript_56864/g.105186  ORF Transcript_56864/g.105186 Transcript_56864/m.105186 type:complete len:119 (+) Transcript_56864:92-448(+)